MPLDRQIFKILGAKTPTRVVSNIDDANYIRRFFNTVQGVGCRIDAPRHDGKGWRIIVDGSSDIDTSGTGEPSIFKTIVRNTFPARIKGAGASLGSYTFQELVPVNIAASGWADREDNNDEPYREGTAWEISGNSTIKIATTASQQTRVAMHESAEGIWWFDRPSTRDISSGTFWAKFFSTTAWEEEAFGGDVIAPARSGAVGTNTIEVNGNEHFETGLVVSMTVTGTGESPGSTSYAFTSPVPYMEQYEVVTALNNASPKATNVRVSSS